MKISSVASLLAGLLCAQAAFAGNWTPVNSPNVGNTPNSLNAVGGASDNDVWAVGVSSASGYTSSRALIEHWNGTRWSIVPSPTAGPTVNILTAVAAVSTNDRVGRSPLTLPTAPWSSTETAGNGPWFPAP